MSHPARGVGLRVPLLGAIGDVGARGIPQNSFACLAPRSAGLGFGFVFIPATHKLLSLL